MRDLLADTAESLKPREPTAADDDESGSDPGSNLHDATRRRPGFQLDHRLAAPGLDDRGGLFSDAGTALEPFADVKRDDARLVPCGDRSSQPGRIE